MLDILNKYLFKNTFIRIRSFLIFVVFCFLMLQIRLFKVFIIDYKKVNNQAFIYKDEGLSDSVVSFGANRLDIVDRNGVLLARNIVSYDLYLKPSEMFDIDGDIEKLKEIFPNQNNKFDEIRNKIYVKKSDIKSRILARQNIFLAEKKRIIEEGIIGIEFQESQKRIYPQNNVASHVVGYLLNDGTPAMGIERALDKELNNLSNYKGKIYLSIDINIQSVLHQNMTELMQKYKAKGAIGLVLKVKTGEIISAISLPDFNPNNIGVYTDNEFFNRFSMGVYELGSVFKVFLVAAAAENGILWSKKYDTINSIKISDKEIGNFRFSRKVKEMDIVDIIKFSSNIGCGRIALEIGSNKQKKLYNDLGFFDAVNIELKDLGKNLIPNFWGSMETVTVSYGHGIAVSPLHFIVAVASVINNGYKIDPTLLKVDNPKQIKFDKQVISKDSSEKVKNLLRLVINEGAGKRGAAFRYDVGGKSGTANKVIKGKYNNDKVLTSFFAAVPMNDPEYIFFVSIDEPVLDGLGNKLATGGYIVAPVISNMISLSGPMLGVPLLN